MIRTGLIAALAGIGVAVAASPAPGGPPVENEDARYSFYRVDDGYLRLDGRSGQVSFCARRSAGWLCQPVPDERVALEAELTRLQVDNAALKKELLTHQLSLPTGIRPDPPAPRVEDRGLRTRTATEFNRIKAFIERVWRRLVEMVVNVQRDIMKRT